MHISYEDILALHPEPPLWWDENAVPRYCEFEPSKVVNIFANEVALIQVLCRHCAKPFTVAITSERMPKVLVPEYETIREDIIFRQLHYGHPPNVGCCPEGPTLTSIPMKVFQYWHRDVHRENIWKRDYSLELNIKPIWM